MGSVETLKVATLNIWNRSGPWNARLPLIRRSLTALRPDVLGLQEVLRLPPPGQSADGVFEPKEHAAPGDDVDQATTIAAGLGYHVVYGTATDLGSGLAFGNALLSRYPVLEHQVIPLPGEESGETRSLLFALLDHPVGAFPVFVTHLNWKLHEGSIRVRQVAFIAERIKELAPIDEARFPPVLMGDLNADPDSDEIRFLRGLATLDGRSVYFADAWAYGGDGTPGYTFDRKNRFAALSHEPPRRIDYIFVRGPDRSFRGEPLVTRLAFTESEDGPAGTVWPSDHFGVFTELSVSSR